ncbi:ComEC family competence protein [Chitinophaga sp. B61]|uniref:ComEC family competence protein n=1 Tax=Chitinophaga rhizophila TaxID=2866212 RepID=A0ABS7GIH6_9BACT|nr:ComEC family competence protein [Chitinophaga rhizophila]
MAALAITVLSYLSTSVRYRFGWLQGLALQLLVVCAGFLLVYLTDVRHHRHYFEQWIKPGDLLLVSIAEPVQQKGRRLKTTASVRYIIRGNTRMAVQGKLLVYLAADSAAMRLQEGSQLLIDSRPDIIARSGNPGAFDYRQYCYLQQIYRQVYVSAGYWWLLQPDDSNRLKKWLIQSRGYCLQVLQQYIGGREYGLAAALLIGYRYDLDRELVQDYTNTGIVHIIAVSGMHLALIYGALLWILGWWPAHRYATIIKGLLIIVLLWAFTLLTGSTASVLRATVMFTFLTIGRFILYRHTNVYNTLAASAFLLLCYEPRLLADVGFQLSYLAVAGIVVCYKWLYIQLQFKRRWLDRLWDMTALTLAAQVFTLPVCLYYFHQFPIYFLPANMIAVPLSTVVLYGEIGLLLSATIPFIAKVTGTCLKLMMLGMNKVTALIGDMPGALLTGIDIHLFSVLCLYVCISALLLWRMHEWRQGLLVFFAGCACWSAGSMYLRLTEQHQHKMVVYNIPGNTVIDVIQGKVVLKLAGQRLKDSLYERHLLPAYRQYGVSSVRTSGSEAGGALAFPGFRVFMVGGKRLVVVDSMIQQVYPKKKFRTDYLLLSHNPRVDIRQLERIFTVGEYIFDASSSLRNIQRWKSDCYMLTLRFFSVPDQGAYVVNF